MWKSSMNQNGTYYKKYTYNIYTFRDKSMVKKYKYIELLFYKVLLSLLFGYFQLKY